MLASNDGFMHSPQPYYDICFIFCKNEEIIAKINNVCPQLKLNFEQVGEFLYAIYLKKGGATRKIYDYTTSLDFGCADIDFDTIQIFSKNRSSNYKNVVTRKMAAS